MAKGSSAGKVWMIIGLLIVVFGVGLTIITNNLNDKRVDEMTKQCEDDGGKAIISEKKSFLSTSYQFKCQQ
ncbi:MAG: hypothetical protein RR595_13355 [Lysinibacillus sp.]